MRTSYLNGVSTMTQVFKRCINDANTPEISFDSERICNYCRQHEQLDKEYPTGDEGWKRLTAVAEKIKLEQRKKEFDCVICVSGDCDSSYLCYLAKEKLGLRPVAAHFDNTWNSKISVENIQRVLKKLDIPPLHLNEGQRRVQRSCPLLPQREKDWSGEK